MLVCVERRATVPGAGFRRDAARSGPPIQPTHRRRGCKVEHTRCLPPALPLLHHRDRALVQVFRVALRHGFPPLLLTEPGNLICTSEETPRGQCDLHQVETALEAIYAEAVED